MSAMAEYRWGHGLTVGLASCWRRARSLTRGYAHRACPIAARQVQLGGRVEHRHVVGADVGDVCLLAVRRDEDVGGRLPDGNGGGDLAGLGVHDGHAIAPVVDDVGVLAVRSELNA